MAGTAGCSSPLFMNRVGYALSGGPLALLRSDWAREEQQELS